MLQTLIELLLGPLLITQGFYVRRVTPKLPEADGERDGVGGIGPPLRLLILGDSAAAGVGVEHQDQALAGRLSERLARHFRIDWKLMAESGVDTQDMLQRIEADTAERFDVVLVSLGVNDVTSRISAKSWTAGQQRLIERLCSRFEARLVILCAIPSMHLFPALPQPLRWYLGQRAKRFNQHLRELVDRQSRCVLLPFDFPFVASAMAADGFHPGPAIYARWAESAADSILGHFQATAIDPG